MKKTIVIYKSKYGATKQYAQWIAEKLDCGVVDVSKVKGGLEDYDVIVFGGGIYVGSINGIKRLNKNMPSGKTVVVFTVGFTEPGQTELLEHVYQKSLPERADIKIFHFQGRIDLDALGFWHKSMIKMVRNSALKKPESERTQEDKRMLQAFGQNQDFVQAEAIDPLVEYIEQIPKT